MPLGVVFPLIVLCPAWQPRAVRILATATHTVIGFPFRSKETLVEGVDLFSMVKPVETPKGEDEQTVLATRAPAQT